MHSLLVALHRATTLTQRLEAHLATRGLGPAQEGGNLFHSTPDIPDVFLAYHSLTKARHGLDWFVRLHHQAANKSGYAVLVTIRLTTLHLELPTGRDLLCVKYFAELDESTFTDHRSGAAQVGWTSPVPGDPEGVQSLILQEFAQMVDIFERDPKPPPLPRR